MKIGEFYEWTTTPECSEDRTAVPSTVKTESELCVWVNSTSLWWVYPGILSDTATECVTQCANVPSLKQTLDTMHSAGHVFQNYTMQKKQRGVCLHWRLLVIIAHIICVHFLIHNTMWITYALFPIKLHVLTLMKTVVIICILDKMKKIHEKELEALGQLQ